MFKEIRHIACERLEEAQLNKHASKPIFVSTLAVTGYPKLKLMLTQDSVFLRTQINVGLIRDYLIKTDNSVPERAMHPSQMLRKNKIEEQKEDHDDQLKEVPFDKKTLMPGYKPKLQKILSHKALKLGQETGVTAEFIVQQTAEQLAGKLEDLFLLFDTF